MNTRLTDLIPFTYMFCNRLLNVYTATCPPTTAADWEHHGCLVLARFVQVEDEDEDEEE
jgi:hypothetical protein